MDSDTEMDQYSSSVHDISTNRVVIGAMGIY